MKRALLLSVLFAAASGAAHAGASHFAVGQVRSVDIAAGTATIAHEPVASLKWPAMSMQFKLADAALGERLQAGGKVAFEFTGEGADWRIVSAIPLASQEPGAAGDSHRGMDGGMGSGGMMGGMCDMMGSRHKR